MKSVRILFTMPLLVITTILSISSCGGTATSSTDKASDNESAIEEPGKMPDEKALEVNGSLNTTDDNSTTATTEQTSVQEVPPSSSELSDEELKRFTDLFNTTEYNGFLTDAFNSPEEINWDAVLEFGAGIAVKNISEEETTEYRIITDAIHSLGDLIAVRRNDLNKYAYGHTGLGDITNDDDVLSWVYIKDCESYYKSFYQSEKTNYTCISGQKSDSHYELRFRVNPESLPKSNAGKNFGKWADRVLTLTMEDDNITIESNTIQWDDFCDPQQTFDIMLSQYDSPVHLITYSAIPDESTIMLIKDGNYLDSLDTSVHSDESSCHLNKIKAIGFFDFNYDGKDDIAVIGDSDLGSHILLYESTFIENMFQYLADFDEAKAAAIGSNLTISGIKKALIGDNQTGEYSSYQDFYTHLAWIYHISDENYKFDLVYTDDDDIPELVIDDSYYGIGQLSLYSFENGCANCLINSASYGGMGTSPYRYIPKKGIYISGNATEALSIYETAYESKHDDNTIATDYVMKEYYYMPDYYDTSLYHEQTTSDGETIYVKYYNKTDKEMTDDEVKAVIDSYESYEKSELSGTMDYDNLIKQLRK